MFLYLGVIQAIHNWKREIEIMIKYISITMITRTHFGPSDHHQNSMNFPNYSREIRQFSLTVRTDKKRRFFPKIYQNKQYRNISLCWHFNFEKITMKLYSLLISTKKNIKALKKTKLFSFPGRILPCKQNSLQYIYYTLYHKFPRPRQWDQSLLQGTWK